MISPATVKPEAPYTSGETAFCHGTHEIHFTGAELPPGELPIQVSFSLPSRGHITVRGFLCADGSARARCYIKEAGRWVWEAKTIQGKGIGNGDFHAEPSNLPGKIRVSLADPRQFQYANKRWYLHFGDMALRYLHPEERRWRSYIDQAAQAGFTKIRVWLAESSDLLYDRTRKRLDLPYWDQVDERLAYALERHPQIQIQLILFGRDIEELKRYEDGNPLSHVAARYAQERFSALANVHWSVADVFDAKDETLLKSIDRAGSDLYAGEQWNSAVTTLAPAGAEIPFAGETWFTYMALSSVGQASGDAILTTHPVQPKPVTIDSDRQERREAPRFPRYYFRRYFWGVLLSRGHPTYAGLETDHSYRKSSGGIEGYYDACNSGKLKQGAHDLLHIRKFFRESGITLERWIPDDGLAGGQPLLVKAMRSDSGAEVLAYVANPDAHAGHDPTGKNGIATDEFANASETFTTFTLALPFSSGVAKWFDPRAGEWKGEMEITKDSTTFLTPSPGDWVVHVQRT